MQHKEDCILRLAINLVIDVWQRYVIVTNLVNIGKHCCPAVSSWLCLMYQSLLESASVCMSLNLKGRWQVRFWNCRQTVLWTKRHLSFCWQGMCESLCLGLYRCGWLPWQSWGSRPNGAWSVEGLGRPILLKIQACGQYQEIFLILVGLCCLKTISSVCTLWLCVDWTWVATSILLTLQTRPHMLDVLVCRVDDRELSIWLAG